jgi:hypothetical protein
VAQMETGKGTPVVKIRQQFARELGFPVKGS